MSTLHANNFPKKLMKFGNAEKQKKTCQKSFRVLCWNFNRWV